MVLRRKILWKGVTVMEPDTVAFVCVGSLTSVPVYICIMDHLHVCGIFVGGEEVKSIYVCSQE